MTDSFTGYLQREYYESHARWQHYCRTNAAELTLPFSRTHSSDTLTPYPARLALPSGRSNARNQDLAKAPAYAPTLVERHIRQWCVQVSALLYLCVTGHCSYMQLWLLSPSFREWLQAQHTRLGPETSKSGLSTGASPRPPQSQPVSPFATLDAVSSTVDQASRSSPMRRMVSAVEVQTPN
jgi:hypothetical protein